MDFPAFRRYSNGKSYFKLINNATLEEVQVIGKYYTIHVLEAKILPERNLINDLLAADVEHIEKINLKEYHDFLEKCRNELVEKHFG